MAGRVSEHPLRRQAARHRTKIRTTKPTMHFAFFIHKNKLLGDEAEEQTPRFFPLFDAFLKISDKTEAGVAVRFWKAPPAA